MNEILNNEEMMEQAIEEATVGTGKFGKYALATIVSAGAAYVLYKTGKIVKGKIDERKAKKAAEKEADVMIVDESNLVEFDDE